MFWLLPNFSLTTPSSMCKKQQKTGRRLAQHFSRKIIEKGDSWWSPKCTSLFHSFSATLIGSLLFLYVCLECRKCIGCQCHVQDIYEFILSGKMCGIDLFSRWIKFFAVGYFKCNSSMTYFMYISVFSCSGRFQSFFRDRTCSVVRQNYHHRVVSDFWSADWINLRLRVGVAPHLSRLFRWVIGQYVLCDLHY